MARVQSKQEVQRPFTITGRKTVATTKWLGLETLSYVDSNGSTRKWDMATRITRPSSTDVDAVAILAILHSSGSRPTEPETLLVRQFRPPIGAETLELPAGLIDPNEDPSTAALRELKEETGFTGRVSSVSGPLCLSPGLSDEQCRLVVVDVDVDHKDNAQPMQTLEEGERIGVERVRLHDIGGLLQRQPSFAGLAFLVEGIALGLRFPR